MSKFLNYCLTFCTCLILNSGISTLYGCDLLKDLDCSKLFPCLSKALCPHRDEPQPRPNSTPNRNYNIQRTQPYNNPNLTSAPVYVYQTTPSYVVTTPNYNQPSPTTVYPNYNNQNNSNNYNYNTATNEQPHRYIPDSDRAILEAMTFPLILPEASTATGSNNYAQGTSSAPLYLPSTTQNRFQGEVVYDPTIGSRQNTNYSNNQNYNPQPTQNNFPLYWTDFIPQECRSRSSDVFTFRYNNWNILALPQGCRMNLIDPRSYNRDFPTGVNISNIFREDSVEDMRYSPDFNQNSPFALYPDRTFIVHLRYKEALDNSSLSYTRELNPTELYNVVPGTVSNPTRSISFTVIENIRVYQQETLFEAHNYNFIF